MVAQLDAHPTGDQVVAGLTPNILSWRLIMKCFLSVILSLLSVGNSHDQMTRYTDFVTIFSSA